MSSLDSDECLAGGGEAGLLLRERDWRNSALGEPRHWPQPLKGAVSLMLNSPHPIFIVWGDEAVWLFNDPFAALLEPFRRESLGRSQASERPDSWSHIRSLLPRLYNGDAKVFDET
ncbi:hypothetical protein [Microvirga pudoricolor]|uniref:hypothetical protein n=1 Tax=Microvirga pudoricolor TaxID=2778729 RepID=UPI0019524E43|nr:hypothetical protein [Microvirga pudoricolor]MBM6592690.1 hypothetical protein [Microvirga pudoricolor]